MESIHTGTALVCGSLGHRLPPKYEHTILSSSEGKKKEKLKLDGGNIKEIEEVILENRNKLFNRRIPPTHSHTESHHLLNRGFLYFYPAALCFFYSPKNTTCLSNNV